MVLIGIGIGIRTGEESDMKRSTAIILLLALALLFPTAAFAAGHESEHVNYITDQFDEDGVCHVKLVGEGKPIYMTITYMEGYTTSGRKFPKPVK